MLEETDQSNWSHAGTLVSMIIGLGVARILHFAAETLRPNLKTHHSLVAYGWIALFMVMHIEFWWGYQDYIGKKVWMIEDAGLYFTAPIFLVIATDLAIARPNEDGELDVWGYFLKAKKACFWSLIAYMMMLMILPVALNSGVGGLPYQVPRAIAIAIGFLCIQLSSKRAQALLLCAAALDFAAYSVIRVQLG